MPKKQVEPTPCACKDYAVKFDGQERTTACDAESRGVFAPGHDAKLKSLLIFAGTHGHRVEHRTDEGTHEMSHVEAAEQHGFRPQVEFAVSKAAEKAAAREQREALAAERREQREREKVERREQREREKAERAERKRMAEEQEVRLPEPGPARALVGRSEFDGEISADGLFHYQADGSAQVAEKYTVVPAA